MSSSYMSRIMLFACVLLIAGLGSVVSSAEQAVMPASMPEPAADIQPFDVLSTEQPDVCSTEEALLPDDLEIDSSEAQAVCSPPPQCFRDRDCDRICGKGNGVCIRVNSCYRQCACAS